ncbi:PD-(D/E)XK nuclease family protein [Brevundimonas subvibrioides]|uniref:PDDEXK-like family protein n=1 Tax=Brevundimonas subvibrioides TaxID=74313 RepID=UPI0022B46467|nr:PD-(D/E)XK nuclease family protein [Brevundimonas subvibrioides]
MDGNDRRPDADLGPSLSTEAQLGAIFDDADFLAIHRRMSPFNVFEAVGAIRGELRHSNFLAYLLSPNRPHGLGSRALAAFLRRVLDRMEPDERPIMLLELLVAELDDAVVYRERDNIDILIELPSLKLVVAIENKIGASAGDGQLRRYSDKVSQVYPNHKRLFVFLTPDGTSADEEGYIAYGYADMADTLESLVRDELTEHSEAGLVVRHYVEMLRRHVVHDEKLQALAIALYERHKEAFDFIFDARPAATSLVTVVRDSALAVEGLIEDSGSTNLFRFAPEVWDERLTIIKGDPTKWSKTGRGLLFEVKTYNGSPGRVNVSLILGPGDASMRAGVYAEALAQPHLFTGLVKPMGAQWVTIFSRDLQTAQQAKGQSFQVQANSAGLAWSDFQGRSLQPLIDAIIDIDDRLVATASRVAG